MKDNSQADEWRVKGNAHFDKRDLREAIISYNKSLCYAEPGSQQLALAYGNRSAVYLDIGCYDECLENIELARKSNHPAPLKLKIREEKCLKARENQIKDAETDPDDFVKLSFEPNKKIPSLVSCLELRVNNKYGRHVITNRDLSPGDIIAIEDSVIRTIEQVEPRYERCIYCLERKKHNLIPCENCCISEYSRWIF